MKTLLRTSLAILWGLALTPVAALALVPGTAPSGTLLLAGAAINCPPGQIYSTYYRRCLIWNAGPIAANPCPAGFRRIDGKCVRITPGPGGKNEPRLSAACRPGYNYHPILKRCVPRLVKPRTVCPPGQKYDPIRRACGPAAAAKTPPRPAPQCPPGQKYDPVLKTCRSASPPKTAAPPRCPAGQRYSPALKKCLPLPPTKASRVCPKGYRHDAARDRCVYVPEAAKGPCPAGYYYHHYYRRCLPNQYLTTFGRYCPPGQVRIKGRCRPRPAAAKPAARRCPAGFKYHLAAGRCVPRSYFPRNTGRCPDGYYYHHYYRRCLLNRYRGRYGVHCPPGHHLANGRCQARARPRTPSCPTGYYYHHYYRQCLLNRYRASYGLRCPPGYFYHPGQRRCLRQAARPRVRCPAGQVYDPVLGRCRGRNGPRGVSSPPAGMSWCPRGQFFHFRLRRCVPYSYLSR